MMVPASGAASVALVKTTRNSIAVERQRLSVVLSVAVTCLSSLYCIVLLFPVYTLYMEISVAVPYAEKTQLMRQRLLGESRFQESGFSNGNSPGRDVYLSPVFPVPYGSILTPKVSTDEAPGARSPTGSVMAPAAPSAGVVTTPVPLAAQLFATCGDTVSQP